MRPEDFQERPQAPSTNEQAYKETISKSAIFTNTFATILPQTALFDVVNRHFAENNGKHKKAAIFGWDGARADALTVLDNQSALHTIKQDGGLYLAFTGGVVGKKLTWQQTCTAPGWATFLTGRWSSRHSVKTNGGINLMPTFIKTVAKKGYKTRFNYIWNQHNITYILERLFAKDSFFHLKNPENKGMLEVDGWLKEKMLQDIENGQDLVFSIFESPDCMGHQHCFDKDCEQYANSIKSCDAHAKEVIQAVVNRPSYKDEDWLFAIISDHGGIGNNHGAQIIECRTVYIACNKPI